MSDWENNYWLSLKPIIQTAWPDLPVSQLFWDNVIERKDWPNLLNKGEMVVPWAVVKMDVAPTSEWGVGPKAIISPTVWYITSLKAAETANMSATALIMGKLRALQQALFTDWTLGTTLDEIEYSTNSDNPINMSFLDTKLKYQAGSITFQTVVWAF